jgi:hypothetical protein
MSAKLQLQGDAAMRPFDLPVSVRQGLLRNSGQAFPSNQRLLPTNSTRERQLMIQRKVADILDQRSRAAQWRTLVDRPVTVRGRRNSYKLGTCRLGREPDHDAFPIVTVAGSRDWFILWHVPGIHYGEVGLVGRGAGVDLSGRGAAAAICAPGRS